MEYLAKGKRGLVYTDKRNGIKVAIKKKNPKSEAHGRILNEGNMLRILNKQGIGPILYDNNEKQITIEFLEGPLFVEFVERPSSKPQTIQKHIFNLMEQCYKMDKLGIAKEEMVRPVKHIIITKRGPVMLDFERAHYVNKPHNLTQFMQFLTSKTFGPKLRTKGFFVSTEKTRTLSSIYKKDISKRNFNALKALIALRTPFQSEVLELVAKIPKGKLTTYGDIAKAIKKPRAVRAVGTAVKTNPCAPEIPCHRVVKNNGAVGEYSGKRDKATILTEEGIKIKNNKIDLKKYLHKF